MVIGEGCQCRKVAGAGEYGVVAMAYASSDGWHEIDVNARYDERAAEASQVDTAVFDDWQKHAQDIHATDSV